MIFLDIFDMNGLKNHYVKIIIIKQNIGGSIIMKNMASGLVLFAIAPLLSVFRGGGAGSMLAMKLSLLPAAEKVQNAKRKPN